MPLRYKSFCSGSRGNAALLWTASTGVLVDFAPGCQRDCRAALAEAKELCPSLTTVLVTHAHGDHISANSLKILREAGLKVLCHPEVAAQIKTRHGAAHGEIVHTFEGTTGVGDFKVTQAPVKHTPACFATGFVIATTKGARRKACIFTDLTVTSKEHVASAAGADLLFLEANHDADLLAKHGHPGSEYHLSNNQAARFLHQVCCAGAQPQAVVLGHLSKECNRPHLPGEELAAYFAAEGLTIKFDLHIAAPHKPGPVIVLK